MGPWMARLVLLFFFHSLFFFKVETDFLEVAQQMPAHSLGGGFKYFLFSPRSLGMIPILTNIFDMG